MLKTDSPVRLCCASDIPSQRNGSKCHFTEKNDINQPFYTPLCDPRSDLPKKSRFRLFSSSDIQSDRKSNTFPQHLSTVEYVKTKNKNGIAQVPRLDAFAANNSKIPFRKDQSTNSSRTTKLEKSTFAPMRPLPKLIKRPGYIEICCKNVCWPMHQLCLCCGRNTAEGCRKWSTSTEENGYSTAFWSSCALCSDDAYKILNTPVVFKEKIIDPQLLLPLDAELLYYSIHSAKRRQEKQKNSSSPLKYVLRQFKAKANQQEFPVPFTSNITDLNGLTSPFQNQKNIFQSGTATEIAEDVTSSKYSPKKRKKSSRRSRRSRSRSRRRSRRPSKRSRRRSRRSSGRSRRRSRRPSKRSRRRSRRSSDRSRRKSRRRSKRKSRRRR